MEGSKWFGTDFEIILVRALAGEKVELELGQRSYTLSVDPLFRISDESDGCLYLCLGLASLQARLDRLAGFSQSASKVSVTKLGGAQESH